MGKLNCEGSSVCYKVGAVTSQARAFMQSVPDWGARPPTVMETVVVDVKQLVCKDTRLDAVKKGALPLVCA